MSYPYLQNNQGVFLGLSLVLSSNILLMIYFYIMEKFKWASTHNIQKRTIITPISKLRIIHHFKNTEGFLTLIAYFYFTQRYELIPVCYYSISESTQWTRVILLLITQDFLQYLVHRLEHRLHHINQSLYSQGHQKHHQVINPKFDDAFKGSILDTFFMILLPLHLSLHIVRANYWTLTCFGSIYSCWLTIIHTEYSHPWDLFFHRLGLGTSSDHHIHHLLLKYNYGHLFMYWDKLFGTYKDPKKYFLNIF